MHIQLFPDIPYIMNVFFISLNNTYLSSRKARFPLVSVLFFMISLTAAISSLSGNLRSLLEPPSNLITPKIVNTIDIPTTDLRNLETCILVPNCHNSSSEYSTCSFVNKPSHMKLRTTTAIAIILSLLND